MPPKTKIDGVCHDSTRIKNSGMATFYNLFDTAIRGLNLHDDVKTCLAKDIVHAWLTEQVDRRPDCLYIISPSSASNCQAVTLRDFPPKDLIEDFRKDHFYVSINPSGDNVIGFPVDGEELFDSAYGLKEMCKSISIEFEKVAFDPDLKAKALKFLKDHS